MLTNLQTTTQPAEPNTALTAEQQTKHQIQCTNVEQSVGQILVKSGKLKEEKIESILRRQQLKNIRFGEAAIQLGLLKEEDVRFALSETISLPVSFTG